MRNIDEENQVFFNSQLIVAWYVVFNLISLPLVRFKFNLIFIIGVSGAFFLYFMSRNLFKSILRAENFKLSALIAIVDFLINGCAQWIHPLFYVLKLVPVFGMIYLAFNAN